MNTKKVIANFKKVSNKNVVIENYEYKFPFPDLKEYDLLSYVNMQYACLRVVDLIEPQFSCIFAGFFYEINDTKSVNIKSLFISPTYNSRDGEFRKYYMLYDEFLQIKVDEDQYDYDTRRYLTDSKFDIEIISVENSTLINKAQKNDLLDKLNSLKMRAFIIALIRDNFLVNNSLDEKNTIELYKNFMYVTNFYPSKNVYVPNIMGVKFTLIAVENQIDPISYVNYFYKLIDILIENNPGINLPYSMLPYYVEFTEKMLDSLSLLEFMKFKKIYSEINDKLYKSLNVNNIVINKLLFSDLQKKISDSAESFRLYNLIEVRPYQIVGLTMFEVLNNNLYTECFSEPILFNKMLFEYIFTLYVMNTKLIIIHSDLHVGNFTLREGDTEPDRSTYYNLYCVPGKAWVFPVSNNIISYIIDFSRVREGSINTSKEQSLFDIDCIKDSSSLLNALKENINIYIKNTDITQMCNKKIDKLLLSCAEYSKKSLKLYNQEKYDRIENGNLYLLKTFKKYEVEPSKKYKVNKISICDCIKTVYNKYSIHHD